MNLMIDTHEITTFRRPDTRSLSVTMEEVGIVYNRKPGLTIEVLMVRM